MIIKIKKFILYFHLFIYYKLNRPLLFWLIRFRLENLAVFFSKFYNNLNISWRTFNYSPEGNFNKIGIVAEENNLVICIIKYCKKETIERLLNAENINIHYIDTNLSPLHYAYINKNKKMIDVLTKYKANKSHKTLKGKLPHEI